jgi:hypothetical protein
LPLRVLDLCSGLGGASRAFADRGHEVITVDINRKFKPTIVADVRHFTGFENSFDVVLAGPPCQGFSLAGLGYHWRHGPDRAVEEGLSIVKACFRIIREVQPRYYVLENPRGMLRRLIGLPTETIYYCSYGHPLQKPTDLWHNLPVSLKRPCAPHLRSPRGLNAMRDWERDPAVRSLWPYKLSLAVCLACESGEMPRAKIFLPN